MKKKAMTISYEVGDHLYLNITNACPCHCIFCIRNNGDGAYDSDPLWLEHTPTFEEIKTDLEKRDFSKYSQIVFCGFGEPTCRLDMLIKVCDYLHTQKNCPKIRLNTNGLTELFYKSDVPVPALLKGKIDYVSISLNAGDAQTYGKVTQPEFDYDTAYNAMLKFIDDSKKYIPEVKTTVVTAINQEEIEESRKMAEKHGVPLRVREWEH